MSSSRTGSCRPPGRFRSLVFHLGIGAILATIARPVAADVVPTDGMLIYEDVTFVPGVYHLPRGVQVRASGITIDGNGAEIYGNDAGKGVLCKARTAVTIRNLTARHYSRGIMVLASDGVVVEDCNVWDTPRSDDGWADIFDGPYGDYAHAVWVGDSVDCTVRRCDVQDQDNGISLFGCSGCLVEDNNASYNTGWGFTLYASCDNIVRDNIAFRCTRNPAGTWGGEAASLLMVYGSHRNLVEDNSFVNGGDGVFLSGPYRDGAQRPNNFNVFRRNDCSDSPHNGFEATFSEGNLFEDNIAHRCNYGFWLGYSHDTIVRSNRMHDCSSTGIAIEHGRRVLIEDNEIRRAVYGIDLWTDGDDGLVGQYPACADSFDHVVVRNRIHECHRGIRAWADLPTRADRNSFGHRIEGNTIRDGGIGLKLIRTVDCRVVGNRVEANSEYGICCEGGPGNGIWDNLFANAANAISDVDQGWTGPWRSGWNIVGGPRLGGNAWSDYAGVDLDGDCIGDTLRPYTAGGAIAGAGDPLPLIILPDGDEDGLPDPFESEFACGPGEPDSDGDGVDDGVEVRFGLGPMDPAVVTRVVSIEEEPAPGRGIRLRWVAVPGRTCRVLRAGDPGGPWTEEHVQVARDEGDGACSWADRSADLPFDDDGVSPLGPCGFYRIAVDGDPGN